MALTVAQIAAKAFGAVDKAIPDAIHVASVSYETPLTWFETYKVSETLPSLVLDFENVVFGADIEAWALPYYSNANAPGVTLDFATQIYGASIGSAQVLDTETYSTETGAPYGTTTTTNTGRAVIETTKPVQDIFPDYVVGPGDTLVMLEGFTSCKEGWKLTIGTRVFDIRLTQDVLGAGSLFYAVGRERLS